MKRVALAPAAAHTGKTLVICPALTAHDRQTVCAPAGVCAAAGRLRFRSGPPPTF